MTKLLRTFWPALALSVLSLCLAPHSSSAQTPPNLGTAATYGAFTAEGAVDNTGLTILQGDIGTNAGAFTGFPPGVYTGARHVADPESLVAKNDLINANNEAQLIPCDTNISVTMGNGQVLTPRTYCAGPASTLTGTIVLDAQGDPNAVFVIKVGGALDVAARTTVLLQNLANAANVYWIVEGAVSILDSSVFHGTIIANGAIHLYTGSTLQGRMLSVVGAITMASNRITVPAAVPAATLVVVKPNAGDTVISDTKNYQITWTGSSLTTRKTLDYSLDGGQTWTRIGEMNADTIGYAWNVPDTVSKNAMVRVTDANGVTGRSGAFIIKRMGDDPSLIVVRPGSSEVIVGGTPNYEIVWSGVGLDNQKTFEYSLDGGTTWTTIGVLNADMFTYPWNVPDTSTTRGLIRITDKNGITGTSGLFTIIASTTNAIVITRPTASESIPANTVGYQITWTGVGVRPEKTLELSLDNGITFMPIAVINTDDTFYSWNVPDTATSIAMIRITDAQGLTDVSDVFSITKPGQNVGSINSLTLSGLVNNNIGNNQNLGIDWTFTPEIGPNVVVEYLLNAQSQWTTITTVSTSQPQTANWMTTSTGYHPSVHIRVTSTDGMTRTSAPFSIGQPASVEGTLRAQGYALSNYPNPVSQNTTISFTLPVTGDATLIVNDAVGRELMVVGGKNMSAGTHTVNFDASELTSGTYSYRLIVGGNVLIGKMSIVR